MELTKKFVAVDHLEVCNLADELVILDKVTQLYFGLDPVGTRIWQLICGGLDLNGVCKVMLSEFDVEQTQLQHDVVKLATELASRKLFRPDA